MLCYTWVQSASDSMHIKLSVTLWCSSTVWLLSTQTHASECVKCPIHQSWTIYHVYWYFLYDKGNMINLIITSLTWKDQAQILRIGLPTSILTANSSSVDFCTLRYIFFSVDVPTHVCHFCSNKCVSVRKNVTISGRRGRLTTAHCGSWDCRNDFNNN